MITKVRLINALIRMKPNTYQESILWTWKLRNLQNEYLKVRCEYEKGGHYYVYCRKENENIK